MAFSEGTSYLQVIFVLIWIKQTLIWFILKEMEVEMDCLTSRILLQKACSYKCQFCTKVCASSRLVSQVYMVTGQRKCNGRAENTSKQQKIVALVRNYLVKVTLRLFKPISVVMNMVPMLLRQFRRLLQIKKIITNAPRVL